MKKKILLLDGYNLIYRARYSRMSIGEYPTVFNFFRSLRPLVEKFTPDDVYFVLEGRPKKRLEMSPEYKGQRTYHNKDNFSIQRKIIISLLKEYFPFNVIRHPDYECDDVINYLAEIEHINDEVTIISSDTDFIQTISDSVSLFNPVSKKFIEAVQYDYVSHKALTGDKSDNIEGFLGIGQKKAEKLLKEENALESFLQKEGNKEKFDHNYEMIKFHDLTSDEERFELSRVFSPDWEQLKIKFSEFEFNSIIGKEKSWKKYIKTFENLERNTLNV